ncbi:beta-1,4-galactosyltransferase 1-like [Girardinichthys multiradiatus]|uniref:beta-1,4-galactosyltransferase 1-like n=1 Tax=Girardinichthys multiradiatus TaxID=208333 RepID=UPI001FAE304C|nr:beta-1,4-galactosyltransferase 1-like [Girardinichthys multiradiatus]
MLKTIFNFLVLFAVFSLICFSGFLFYSKNNDLLFFTDPHHLVNTKNKTSLNIEKTTAVPEFHQNRTAMPAASGRPLEPCPNIPPNLQGVLYVEFRTNRTLEDVRQHLGPLLQQGGRYKPANCVAKQKVAIIIPFRNRYEHLSHWLHYLHPILIRQQLDYSVYVINQEGDGVFNRAKLMNIGHTEALKEYDYECFVFSDIDLVPLNDRNLYRCSDKPRHLSVAVDKFNFLLPYNTIFGGVTALSREQFLKVNGFSNTFWGWGGEDDDLYQRIVFRGMSISRPDSVIGRYKMIKHGRDLHNDRNPNNVQKLNETPQTIDRDGLNSLSYTVRKIRKDLLYTFITVDVQTTAGYGRVGGGSGMYSCVCAVVSSVHLYRVSSEQMS